MSATVLHLIALICRSELELESRHENVIKIFGPL